MKKNPHLTPEEHRILREKGTEPAFSGELLHNKEKGQYCCKGCNTPLFHSDKKFDSGSGWPSFFDAVDEGKLLLTEDQSLGMERIEVCCSQCGGHLGHLFPDGPPPTGKRYCINSLSLSFESDP